jgi:Tfp pilus assembly PilM family ATPase
LPRYLSLDWDHNQLHIVAATVSGNTVRVQRAAVWQETQSPNVAEAEALGKLLRQRLKDAGIAAAPVLACVGRERVILKEVRYPAVAPAEEPAVVRFQAVKELTDPADEVVIDYTPLGTAPTGERRALVLIVRRELLQAYQVLCQAAGLKLAALTPRPFGTAACLERATEPSAAFAAAPLATGAAPATVAVLTVAERWAEFCILRGDTLVFARAVAVGPTLAGEVRRSLIVHAGQSPQVPVQAVYLAGGGDDAALRERLQDLLGLPVRLLDPFAGAARQELPATGRGAFSGAVGLLHAQASKTGLPINFAHIKQAQSERDPNRRRYILAAACAAVLLLAGAAWCYGQLADADKQIAELTAVNTQLDTQLVPVEEDAKYLKGLSDWNDTGVVLLDELYDLTERFPRDPNVRLMELQYVSLPTTGKDKHIGAITISGIASEDQYAQTFVARLEEEHRFYRISVPDMTVNNTGVDRQFRRKFTTRVDLVKRPPSEYRVSLDTDEDDSRTGRSRNRSRSRGGAGGQNGRGRGGAGGAGGFGD